MKKRSRTKKSHLPHPSAKIVPGQPLTLGLDEKYRQMFHMAVLFVFGLYLVILYFGHQVVPNSDFTAFFQTGQEILSGKLPTSFKRLPGLGVLQVLVSHCVPASCSVHPSLMAGWIVNSVFYVATGVCLYQVARRVLGASAIWYCLLILINPMMLKWMRSPIVETSFTFFIILTCLFLVKGSRWAYLMAVITCLFRYEGVFLIPACFFMDFFRSNGVRKKIFAFVRAGLTATPLAVWMGLTILRRKEGTSVGRLDYIRNYNPDKGMVIGKFARYTWDNSVRCFTFYPDPSVQGVFFTISKILLVVGLVAAALYAIVKKQWAVLGLLSFFVLFCVMHAIRTYTMPRYGFPAIWLTVLLAWYGFQSLWAFAKERKWLPDAAGPIAAVVTILVTVPWALYLRLQQASESRYFYRAQTEFFSLRSASVPTVTLIAVGVILIGGFFLFKRTAGISFRKVLVGLATMSVLFLAVTCNQFRLSEIVRNGAMDLEFKQLANWYREHAMDQKMVTTMPHVMKLYLPESGEVKLLRFTQIKGASPEEFVQDCIRRRIDYVAWDSRIGYSPDNVYYKRWKMNRVAFMVQPKRWGPFEFVAKIQNKFYPNRFINLYKITYPDTPAAAQ